MKSGISLTISALLLGIFLNLSSSCRKQKIPDMGMKDKNITYPAAYVVNGENSTLSVINLSNNEVQETIELMKDNGAMAMWPHHLSLYSIFDIHRLAVAVPGMDLSAGHSGGMENMKGQIMVVDATKGMVIKAVKLPASNHNAAFSPDGREIWTSQMRHDGTVLVYDAQTYAVKNTITVGSEPAEVSFSADGSKAYVANGADNTVSVIDPATKQVLKTIAVGAEPVGAWVGTDGKMYVDNEEGKSITVLDVATDEIIQTIDLGFMPGSAAHNGPMKELWITDPDNGRVHYWRWDDVSEHWAHGEMFETAAGAHAVAFTPDGETAYVTNQMAASVSVIDVGTHTKIKDIPVGKKPNGIVLKP